MLRFLFVALLLGSGEKVPVKGATTVSGVYCGGVAPRPEDLAAVQAVRVDPNVRLRLYRGRKAQGEALEVKSDEKGFFTLVLSDGDWCVVDGRREIQPGSKPTPRADEKCWAAASVGCDAVWTIDSVTQSPPQLALHFQQRCSWSPPCGPYQSPPPSAVPH